MHAQQNCVSVKSLLSRLSACLGLIHPPTPTPNTHTPTHLIQNNAISAVATQQPCTLFWIFPKVFPFPRKGKERQRGFIGCRILMDQEDFWTSPSTSAPLVPGPLGPLRNPPALRCVSRCVSHACHVLISLVPLIRWLNSRPVEGFIPRLQTIYGVWVTLFHW